MARDIERRRTGGLRLAHGAAGIVVAVVGVLVAFWALSFIAGILWGLVKVAIVIAVVAGVVSLLARRRR